MSRVDDYHEECKKTLGADQRAASARSPEELDMLTRADHRDKELKAKIDAAELHIKNSGVSQETRDLYDQALSLMGYSAVGEASEWMHKVPLAAAAIQAAAIDRQTKAIEANTKAIKEHTKAAESYAFGLPAS